ncbi:hypothetical protein ACFLXI_07165 [Chloroflexota bacterium]
MKKNSVESFHNKFSNERVFVIGNGPSLRKTPLDLLVNEYSIAMNRISLLYSSTRWRPSFFVCTTSNIKKPDWRRDILKTIDLGVDTFVWEKLKNFVGERENVNYLNCSHGREVSDDPPLDWWSYDISKRVCKFGTSMLVALQIVVYLGFNEIYILGADLGYIKTFPQKLLTHKQVKRLLEVVGIDQQKRDRLYQRLDKNHFDSKYGTPGFPPHVLNRNMIGAHKLAKTASERIGVKINNATLGGNLDVYPRANLFHVLPSSRDEV